MVLGDEDDRAAAVPDGPRRLPEPRPLPRVERRGRLVEEEHLRVGEERDREVEALAVADREGRRRAVVRRELEPLEQRRRGRPPARAARRARGSAAARAVRSGRAAAASSRRGAPRPARPCPRSARSAPARIASSVDLPAPFGPTSASVSPGGHVEIGRLERDVVAVPARDAARREQRASLNALRRRGLRPPARPAAASARSRPRSGTGAALGPRLETRPAASRTRTRRARRRAGAARRGSRPARRSPRPASRPKMTRSGWSRSALPITFGTTMWPSTWWMTRKRIVTQMIEIGWTTTA